MTPQQAALLHTLPSEASEARVLGSRKAPNGSVAVVFLYTVPTNLNGMELAERGIGYAEMVPNEVSGWESEYIALDSNAPAPWSLEVYPDFSLVAFDERPYYPFWGPVLDPNVKSIEIQFSDGRVEPSEINEPYFLFYYDRSELICSLRLLGPRGEVLRQHAIVSSPKCP